VAKSTLGLIIMSLSFLLSSCSTTGGAKPLNLPDSYRSSVESLTVNDELYNGWTNVFHYHATLVTESLYEQQIDVLAKAKLWSEDETRSERRRLAESVANETQVFLSFYTPEIQYNDLNESGSVWRIFLDVDGKRYTGRVNKYAKNYADTKSLYPQHTPWSKAYMIQFPVSFLQIKDKSKARLVITGSLGVSQKSFQF
jgi:hypothetical protein